MEKERLLQDDQDQDQAPRRLAKGDEHSHTPVHLAEPYYKETPYSDSENASLTARLWHDIDIDSGVIALSDDYVASKGLPPAQRFPWDATKGVYIVHGYHNLHCLKIIYISMAEHRLGEPQSRKWHHISHCFDALRRQVLCDADDTPRTVQRELEGVSGVGQNRQCRDWGELERWAKAHTACYKRPDRPVEGMRNIEKYKFCPEGSGPVQQISPNSKPIGDINPVVVSTNFESIGNINPIVVAAKLESIGNINPIVVAAKLESIGNINPIVIAAKLESIRYVDSFIIATKNCAGNWAHWEFYEKKSRIKGRWKTYVVPVKLLPAGRSQQGGGGMI